MPSADEETEALPLASGVGIPSYHPIFSTLLQTALPLKAERAEKVLTTDCEIFCPAMG